VCDVRQQCADAPAPAPGFGPQRLATLAAYALRRELLDWLETFKVEKDAAACMRARREARAVADPLLTTVLCSLAQFCTVLSPICRPLSSRSEPAVAHSAGSDACRSAVRCCRAGVLVCSMHWW